MEKITSKSNQLIKDTKKLTASSRARQENNAFVLEGARLCFDVLNSVYQIKYFFVTQAVYDRYGDKCEQMIARAERSFLISSEVADRLSDTSTSQGVFAVCSMKRESERLTGSKIIALDNVQDPSNVGAIIRTAEALGIDGIVTYNCCDLFNPKALRASMGSVLRMKVMDVENLKEALSDFKDDGYKIYSTVPSQESVKITEIDFSTNCICVIGNEANGVEENIKSISDKLITIPMLGRAESLNASVAASITMWEMLR